METLYRHVSLDSDKDLTGNLLEVSLDRETWTAADHFAAPASASGLIPPAEGFTRYWWRVLIGPGQALDPTGIPEPLTLFGRLTDAPEVLFPSWVLGTQEPDTAPALTDYCWPVVVPTPAVAEWNALDGATRAYAEALAVTTLRTLTAYQVGGCPVTIYPRRSRCVHSGSSDRPDVYPVLDSGTWYNVGCGCAGADRSALLLPRAYGGVVAVRLDGVTLDPSTWRWDGVRLHRTDGTRWTFTPGGLAVDLYENARPDGLAALAAGALAVEYARARSGGSCRLPSRATSVARSGVTVQLASPADMYPQGLTGITEADLFIRSVNPHRLVTAPTVWSPDLQCR
jgi:hypothetical protein